MIEHVCRLVMLVLCTLAIAAIVLSLIVVLICVGIGKRKPPSRPDLSSSPAGRPKRNRHAPLPFYRIAPAGQSQSGPRGSHPPRVFWPRRARTRLDPPGKNP